MLKSNLSVFKFVISCPILFALFSLVNYFIYSLGSSAVGG